MIGPLRRALGIRWEDQHHLAGCWREYAWEGFTLGRVRIRECREQCRLVRPFSLCECGHKCAVHVFDYQTEEFAGCGVCRTCPSHDRYFVKEAPLHYAPPSRLTDEVVWMATWVLVFGLFAGSAFTWYAGRVDAMVRQAPAGDAKVRHPGIRHNP